MKKFLLFTLVFSLTLTLGLGIALAGKDKKGNEAPNGAHYNLNLIGVDKAKKDHVDMTDSNRHTIFVALGKNQTANTKIFLVQTPDDAIDFQVCDGNGFDEAISCFDEDQDGEPDVIAPSGAVFMLPANADWVWDAIEEEWIPSGLLYEVYARAVGAPGGTGTITTCKVNDPYDETEIPECSLDFVTMNSSNRPSKFKNVTRELTSICVDEDLDGKSDHCYTIFSDDMTYFWDYDNNGLKLVQLRFYPVDTE